MDIYAREGYVINLGRCGENETQNVIFDLSSWAEDVSSSYITLYYAPIGGNLMPCGTSKYNSTTKSFIWTVNSFITKEIGAGKCQLVQTDTTAPNAPRRAISNWYDTIITSSIFGNDEIGEDTVYNDFLSSLDSKLDEINKISATAEAVDSLEKVDATFDGSNIHIKVPVIPLSIKKSYSTRQDIYNDINNTEIGLRDIVIINGDVEQEENAQVYMKNVDSSAVTYHYVGFAPPLPSNPVIGNTYIVRETNCVVGYYNPSDSLFYETRTLSEGVYIYSNPITGVSTSIYLESDSRKLYLYNTNDGIFYKQSFNIGDLITYNQKWFSVFTYLSDLSGQKGDPGVPGEPGTAATISVGTVSSVDFDSGASIIESGTPQDRILNFQIPRGQKGDQGLAGSIEIGTVTVTTDGTASVINTGSTSAAILNFAVPRGPKGDQGDPGNTGRAAVIAETGHNISIDNGYTSSGPSATVRAIGEDDSKTFDFSFSNLKSASVDSASIDDNGVITFTKEDGSSIIVDGNNFYGKVSKDSKLSKYWAQGYLDDSGQEINDGQEYYHNNSKYNSNLSKYWAQGHWVNGVEQADVINDQVAPYFHNNAKYEALMSRYWAEGHLEKNNDGQLIETSDSEDHDDTPAEYYGNNARFYAKYLANLKIYPRVAAHGENPTITPSSESYSSDEEPFIPGGDPTKRLRLDITIPEGAPGKIWKPYVDKNGILSWTLLDPNDSTSGAESLPDSQSIQGPAIKLSKPEANSDSISSATPTVDVTVSDDSTDLSGLTKKLTFNFSGFKGEKGDVGSISITHMVSTVEELPEPNENNIPLGTMYGVGGAEGIAPVIYVCSENSSGTKQWYEHGTLADSNKIIFAYYHDGVFYARKTIEAGQTKYTDPISPSAEVLYINLENGTIYYYDGAYKKSEDPNTVHASISSIQNGQILKYDNTVNTFVNSDLPKASNEIYGLVKTDGTLPILNGEISLPVANSTTLGGIKAGRRVSISDNGELSAVQIKFGRYINNSTFIDEYERIYTGESEVLYLDTTTNILYYYNNGSYITISKKQISDGYLFNGKFYSTKSGSQYLDEISPESNKLYIDRSNNYLYRYDGSSYVLISKSYTRVGYINNNKFFANRTGSEGSYVYSNELKAETDVTYIDIPTNIIYRYSIISGNIYIPLTAQANWIQTDSNARDFIKNKPTILSNNDIEDILRNKISVNVDTHTLSFNF